MLCNACGRTVPSGDGYVETFDCRHHFMTREEMIDQAVREFFKKRQWMGAWAKRHFLTCSQTACVKVTVDAIRAEFARIAERERARAGG